MGKRTDDQNFKTFHFFCRQNHAFAPVFVQALPVIFPEVFPLSTQHSLCALRCSNILRWLLFSSTISILDACFRHTFRLCYHTTIHCIDHKNTNEGILQGLGWQLPTAHNDKFLRKTSTVSMITAILRPFVPMTIANTSPCFSPERRQQQHQQIE